MWVHLCTQHSLISLTHASTCFQKLLTSGPRHCSDKLGGLPETLKTLAQVRVILQFAADRCSSAVLNIGASGTTCDRHKVGGKAAHLSRELLTSLSRPDVTCRLGPFHSNSLGRLILETSCPVVHTTPTDTPHGEHITFAASIM